MRRIITLFLLLCMLLPMAFSCSNSNEAEESVVEPDVSSVSEPKQNARKTEIDALLGDAVDRAEPSVNLLKGKSYVSSREVSADYPDDVNILTDGRAPIGFVSGFWAGYNSQTYEPLDVTIDLGKEYKGISDFSATVLQYAPYGILAPESVTVFVSADGGEAVAVGTAYAPDGIGDETYKFNINLQGEITARYITFQFNDLSSPWLFVGELEAYAYGEEYASNAITAIDGEEYYGFLGLPDTDGEEWSPEDADYDKEGVLKPQNVYILANEEISVDFTNEWYNHKSSTMLYDGKLAAEAGMDDGNWMHFTRGSREIIYDFGKISSVSGFKAGFLKQGDAGINAPLGLSAEVSSDGTEWQTVYVQWMLDSAGDNFIMRLDEEFPSAFRARFVRFSFDINAHVYIDEIQVIGSKNASGAVEPDSENSLVPEIADYATAEDFDGVENILLSYNGQLTDDYGHDEAGLITAEEYLPYVAYLDEEGNITDTFFDGFVFLAYGVFNRDGFAATAAGWKQFLDDVYYPDRNMDALNECAGTVGDALSITDYKVSVYTAVSRPYADVDFGDIDGDGIDEDFTDINDRKKTIKWMMDEEYRRFKEGNYAHLDFKGFYWYEEEIYYTDALEVEVVKYAVDYAHSLGVKIFWIPYNGADGTFDWYSLGFDLACLQPNYMFGSTFDNGFLYSTAEVTRKYGMCVEMEISDVKLFNDLWRFNEYMRVGAETGYMNSVKIYYQSGVPGPVSDAYNSDDAVLRRLYDDIYLYSKREYVPLDEASLKLPEYTGETVTKKGRTLKIDYNFGDLECYEDYLVLAVAPKYGSVKINRDGTINYIPAKGFIGDDSFAVQLQVGYAKSALLYINVQVEE